MLSKLLVKPLIFLPFFHVFYYFSLFFAFKCLIFLFSSADVLLDTLNHRSHRGSVAQWLGCLP